MNKSSYLPAQWSANKPENIHAVTTLIKGGVSTGDYSEFNLASHVGDDLRAVYSNRKKLRDDLHLPSEPVWLDQVHSNKVIVLEKESSTQATLQADASISRTKGIVCSVLTADCLPVFFCNQAGTEVAAAHAGWRGLHTGILSNTLEAMNASANEILVSLGPAIGPQAFEVGEEVYQAFMDKNPVNNPAFAATTKGHYLCDIYQLAGIELQLAGVEQITGCNACTYHEDHRFYSYRRQKNTGRMASLIWLS